MGCRLILVRHGDAAWPTANQADRDRPLTETGQRQAAHIATAISEAGWIPELIVSSPAVRAQQTAAALVGTLAAPLVTSAQLYEGHHRDVQQRLRDVESTSSTVLLVGHNPTFSHLASSLSGVRVSLGTANAALLTTTEPSWNTAPLLDAGWHLDRHLVPG